MAELMTAKQNKRTPWPALEATTEDGRRQRSDRSRRAIIEALFDLMREGVMQPTAADVAERADVGLRTVFRHFEDMESIFEEMTDELKAVMMPRFLAPLSSTSWRDQLFEMADRNAEIYEDIFPMRVALVIRRFQSDFLTRQYKSEVELLRSALKSILPKHVTANRILFAAIEVNLTFATWRRLREDQNLSVARAKATLTLILSSLIAGVDDTQFNS
ncbi:MAG: TetR/AcrR family transcriptional regulator [Pseudomonadota bacterium]